MKNKLNGREAKCPFYAWHTSREICCECPVPVDGCALRVMFEDHHALGTQYRLFCCNDWEKCEIARMNGEKYEDVAP